MHFKLMIRPENKDREVRHNYTVFAAMLFLLLLVLFGTVALIGGPMAALYYVPVSWCVLVLLLLLIAAPRLSGGSKPDESSGYSIEIDETGVHADFAPFLLPVGWEELHSILLRFNVLTITFRNNQSFQYGTLPPGFDEAELELFSAHCILMAKRGGNRR